jgi:acyl-CoA synthetase (AMP-forming)/AMP-acid ligase II
VHLGQIAAERPGKAAVIMACSGQTITFAELDAVANRLAHVLSESGLRPGGHLARYKCPRSVDFRADLPRHPTGKLLKRVLRDEYARARAVQEAPR